MCPFPPDVLTLLFRRACLCVPALAVCMSMCVWVDVLLCVHLFFPFLAELFEIRLQAFLSTWILVGRFLTTSIFLRLWGYLRIFV